MVLSVLAFISFMAAPEKGYLYKLYKARQTRIRILQENVLKTLYHLGEPSEDYMRAYTVPEIIQRRQQLPSDLKSGLNGLKRQGLIQPEQTGYSLTPIGLLRAKRIVKLHRLWEMYLTQFLNLAPDHVHDDADTIEHLITPELELKLEEQLKYPSKDPHERNIPYA
jgi:manganese/zinc/iron transport system permease protein